jgi:hypothetical protein
MPVCAVEIWSSCKALVASGISETSLRGTWDFVPSQSGAGDIAAEDAAAVLRHMGGAEAILATGTNGGAMGPLVSGLAAEPGREMEDGLQAEGELERRTLRQAQAG